MDRIDVLILIPKHVARRRGKKVGSDFRL